MSSNVGPGLGEILYVPKQRIGSQVQRVKDAEYVVREIFQGESFPFCSGSEPTTPRIDSNEIECLSQTWVGELKTTGSNQNPE